MKHTHIISSILISALLFVMAATQVVADDCTSQYGQYGSGTGCGTGNVTVDKKVYNPITKTFVDNLGSSNDATNTVFSAGQEVLFELWIKNGDQNTTATTVTVKDVFPQYVTFEGGPGTYSNNTLTFTETNLKPNETRKVQVLGKINTNLPKDPIFCVVNTATVYSGDTSNTDKAQLCIQTSVMGTTTLPVAGFNYLYLLIPFGVLGFTGIALLRKQEA